MRIAGYAKLTKRFICPCLIAGLVVVGASLAPARTNLPKLGPPPESEIKRLGLDRAFYKKYVDAGLPVISSEKVSDAALREVAYLIDKMIGHRPEFFKSLNKLGVRIVVMAHNEFTTQIPVSRRMDPDYWDWRARGICGGNMVSCAEENLLNFKGDKYEGECIFIHEFGHKTIGFTKDIRKVYDTGKKKGLWKGTYAATNFDEVWAEGVQSWFNCNRQNDSKHNHVNTRAELKKYDPELAKLLSGVFGDRPWRYKKVADRKGKELAHLGDYDPSKAPAFVWPQRVLDGWQRHLARVKRRKEGKARTTLIQLVGSSGGDKARASLTAWRKRIEKKYVAKCELSFGGDKAKSLDNLDRLKKVDLMVVYGGGMEISGDQLRMVKDYVASGRPIIAIRTGSCAFKNYTEFDTEVLGGSFACKKTIKTIVNPAAVGHPVLSGLGKGTADKKIDSAPKLAKSVTLLLAGIERSGKKPHPVAWVRAAGRQRVFCTSMGSGSDFADDTFNKLLDNAIVWTAGRSGVKKR